MLHPLGDRGRCLPEPFSTKFEGFLFQKTMLLLLLWSDAGWEVFPGRYAVHSLRIVLLCLFSKTQNPGVLGFVSALHSL